MYKHFQASSPKIICDKLSEHKMKIHSIEKTNGMIQCVAEPCDDKRKVGFLAGSVLQVTKNLNSFDRSIEGKVLIQGHSAVAFYRIDEKKEAEIKEKMEAESKKAQEEKEKAEKEAKKAEMKKKMEELKKQMESVDSEPSEAEKEAEKAKALEEKRQAELKKAKSKKAKEEAEKANKAKEEAQKAKKDKE